MQLPTARTRHAHRSTLYYTALVVSAAMIQSLDNLTLLLNTRAPVLWSPIQQVYRKRRAVVLYRVTPCLPGYKSVRVVEIQVSGKRCPHRLPVLIIVHARGRGHRGRSVFPDPRDLYDDLWDLQHHEYVSTYSPTLKERPAFSFNHN